MRKSLLITLSILSLLSVLFYFLERPYKKKEQFKKPWSELRLDIIYWVMQPLFLGPFIKLSVGFITFLVVFGLNLEFLMATQGHGFGLVSGLPVVVQIALALFVIDFQTYWIHRWMHETRVGWRIHVIHHTSIHLDWLSSVRTHPFNAIVNRSAAVLSLLFLGFSLKSLAVAVPFLVLYGLFLHANIPWSFGRLQYVFVTPKFHRWHHTSRKQGFYKNYAGLFSFIDKMFGTYYMPVDEKPLDFGRMPNPPKLGFWSHMFWPFRLYK